jgi:hypothetical protein
MLRAATLDLCLFDFIDLHPETEFSTSCNLFADKAIKDQNWYLCSPLLKN